MVSQLHSALTKCPALADLPEPHLGVLIAHSEPRAIAAGEHIFRTDEPADHFFVIVSGRAALEIHSPAGSPLTVTTLEAHDLLGWSWLFSPYRWHFDARAVTDCGLIQIEAEAIRRHAESDHEFGYRLLHRFAAIAVDRLQTTRMRLLDVYASPGRG